MRNNLEAVWTPPGAEDYRSYLIPNHQMPPLQVERLETKLLVGGARIGLKVPVAGDFTLALKYKQRLGAVISYEECDNDDLEVLQLQGAKQKGVRVTAGMRWVDHFADQSLKFIQDPGTTYTRLVIPTAMEMRGIGNMTDEAMVRYREFVHSSGMKYSKDERLFVRDFPHKQREI